ncbi:MAG: hypothetical protein GXY83_31560 [Rhodopirellula sp.]|nr:hypothetical protein [Rhodopirellula sp.]
MREIADDRATSLRTASTLLEVLQDKEISHTRFIENWFRDFWLVVSAAVRGLDNQDSPVETVLALLSNKPLGEMLSPTGGEEKDHLDQRDPRARHLPWREYDRVECAAVRRRIDYLLTDHPAPFDLQDTMRTVGGSFADIVESSFLQPSEFRLALENWTQQAGSSEEIEPTLWRFPLDARFLSQLLPASLREFSERLKELRNPIGRALARDIGHAVREQFRQSWHWVLDGILDSQVMLATLALRMFRESVGREPSTLEEVVTKGMLRRVPVDPFSRKPLVLSASNRVTIAATDEMEKWDSCAPFRAK